MVAKMDVLLQENYYNLLNIRWVYASTFRSLAKLPFTIATAICYTDIAKYTDLELPVLLHKVVKGKEKVLITVRDVKRLMGI